MAACPILIGETLSGKYRIDRVLGEGGMGVVVLAHHLELDQPVAIKFLLEGMADKEEGAERFRREARAAAKIHSDHVVRVLDVGVMADGVRYMVMEYLEGRDLAAELQDRGPFPLGAACGFILEAIDAVGHAHAVGIVHRDLKPANLFLAKRPDGSQRIKVLDFGISKSVGSSTGEQLSLTKTSAWIGSPLYMAPEQMQSARDVDSRADIWSLGAILYELICGAPPYEADSLPQLCNLLITTDAPSIQTRNPGVPDDLAQAIMDCLVRDKQKRTADVSELAQVLIRYATTITGSGMSRAYLERASFHSGSAFLGSAFSGESAGLPAAHALSESGVVRGKGNLTVPGTSDELSRSSDEGVSLLNPTIATAGATVGARTTMASEIGPEVDLGRQPSGTHAAWGATDKGSRRGTSPLIWTAAGLALLLGVGYVLFQPEPDRENAPDPSDVASASMGDSGFPEAREVDEAALVPEPAVVPQEQDPKSAAQGEDAPSANEATDAAEAKDERQAQPAPKLPPKPYKRPVARTTPAPAPKASPASSPAPAPAPTPQPVSKPADEFSDFGGRR